MLLCSQLPRDCVIRVRLIPEHTCSKEAAELYMSDVCNDRDRERDLPLLESILTTAVVQIEHQSCYHDTEHEPAYIKDDCCISAERSSCKSLPADLRMERTSATKQ
jgi:hypothetical protein